MTYDEFKQAWILALHESDRPSLRADDLREAAELCSMDRTAKPFVGTLGQDAEPFHIGAR